MHVINKYNIFLYYMGIQNVKMTKNKIYKTFRSDVSYNRELMIYKMNLPYVPKLLSYDNNKRIIILDKVCCKSLNRVPIPEREKYYKQAKDLFFKFYKDTGYYMYDYHPGNIILNHKTNKLKIIDFEYIGKEKKNNYRNGIQSFLTKIGVLKKNKTKKYLDTRRKSRKSRKSRKRLRTKK